MKVLLASEPGGGGVARHFIDLAGGLVARGHDVTLAYSRARAEDWYLAALELLPCRRQALPMQRNPGRGDLVAVAGLRRLIRHAGPFDVVHGHSSKAGALLRLAALGQPGACLYTPHALVTMGPTLSSVARKVYGAAERLLAPLADGIICVSDEERDHARSLGIGAGRLHVVNNGIAPLTQAPRDMARRELGLHDDDVCVGFVGRFAAQKAPERLLAAVVRALPHCPALKLVLVGDGEDRDSLRREAADLDVADRVRFVRDPAAVRLMPGFDIFAMSSRYEAFPYVFLEAAASGLPIVTTAVGGAPAVVTEGSNGHIVPQTSAVPALAAHIARLGRDRQMRERMGSASLRIAERFSLDTMVAETEAVYRRLVEVRQGRRGDLRRSADVQ